MAEPITFSETSEELSALGYFRTVFGSAQNYRPLPAIVYDPDGEMRVVTRWRPTEDERRAIMDGACIEVSQLTFRNPLQPLLVGVQGVRYGELGNRPETPSTKEEPLIEG